MSMQCKNIRTHIRIYYFVIYSDYLPLNTIEFLDPQNMCQVQSNNFEDFNNQKHVFNNQIMRHIFFFRILQYVLSIRILLVEYGAQVIYLSIHVSYSSFFDKCPRKHRQETIKDVHSN